MPEYVGPSLSNYLLVLGFLALLFVGLYYIKKNKHIISRTINSKKIEDFVKILQFVIDSNVEVDQTKDLFKDKEEEKIAEMITQELLSEALRVKDLNAISRIVYKEDFYGFINAGQNVMRTLEENGFESKLAKKYLEHLVKNNIL